ERYRKTVINPAQEERKKFYSKGWAGEWSALVKEKSHGEIDPSKSDEDEHKAEELYPPSQFFKDKANRHVTEAQRKAEEKEKPSNPDDPLDLHPKKKEAGSKLLGPSAVPSPLPTPSSSVTMFESGTD